MLRTSHVCSISHACAGLGSSKKSMGGAASAKDPSGTAPPDRSSAPGATWKCLAGSSRVRPACAADGSAWGACRCCHGGQSCSVTCCGAAEGRSEVCSLPPNGSISGSSSYVCRSAAGFLTLTTLLRLTMLADLDAEPVTIMGSSLGWLTKLSRSWASGLNSGRLSSTCCGSAEGIIKGRSLAASSPRGPPRGSRPRSGRSSYVCRPAAEFLAEL
mmetsp:Transcript_85516/g.242129  ORF Transcript_85516/g.242129 Transcript_85516/m.242129 type:complete len:215 (+) Transcript_85516:192-836(+)